MNIKNAWKLTALVLLVNVWSCWGMESVPYHVNSQTNLSPFGMLLPSDKDYEDFLPSNLRVTHVYKDSQGNYRALPPEYVRKSNQLVVNLRNTNIRETVESNGWNQDTKKYENRIWTEDYPVTIEHRHLAHHLVEIFWQETEEDRERYATSLLQYQAASNKLREDIKSLKKTLDELNAKIEDVGQEPMVQETSKIRFRVSELKSQYDKEVSDLNCAIKDENNQHANALFYLERAFNHERQLQALKVFFVCFGGFAVGGLGQWFTK